MHYNPSACPTLEIPTISASEQGVKDALKDFPNISYTVQEGTVVLTGEIEKSKLIVVMQALQALNLKVDSKGLTKK